MGGELKEHNERLRRAAIDKGIRDGGYPIVIPRPDHKPNSRVVPFPWLLIVSGIFKYQHKVTEYTIEKPFRIKTPWGVAYYRGPALTQKSLNVLAATLQTAGTQILRGPRKSFSHLKLVGGKEARKVLLEETQTSLETDDYEFVDAFFGDTVLSRIALCAFGDIDGNAINLTRRELVYLMDGRFYVQVNPKRGAREFPEWLSVKPEEERLRDDDETVLDTTSQPALDISGAMRRVLSYDPINGSESPLTVHPFFDPTFKNASRMTGGIGFVFSPFLTHLLTETPTRRPTYLDLAFRDKIVNDGMALQLHSFVCAQTSRKEPVMRIGYDKLIEFFNYDNVIRKKLKDGVYKEYPATAEFVRQITKRLDTLANKGFIEDWSTKPCADPGRKTDIVTIKRRFYVPEPGGEETDLPVPG
jgi:hypothetical protein